MAKIETLLQAIENGDGQSVRDFLITYSFEDQLTVARRLQTMNLRRRNQQDEVACALPATIYAQYEIIDSVSGSQERLTIRIVKDGRANDVYIAQRHSESGRMLVRFHCQPKRKSPGSITLSRIETYKGEACMAFTPGTDGFGALTPLNMVG
jgi:hypothetical protein